MRHDDHHSDPVVLVVEDEILVRMIAVDVLADAGYRVIEAESADAALPIIDSRDDIRIIVTDVRMPGRMDGLELARHVASQRDDVVILVTSGHARPSRDELPPRSAFIGKPYRAETLLAEVRQLASAGR